VRLLRTRTGSRRWISAAAAVALAVGMAAASTSSVAAQPLPTSGSPVHPAAAPTDDRAPATVTATAAAGPVGSSVSVEVTVVSDASVIGGEVTVVADGRELASGTVSGGGVATVSVADLTAGSHVVRASFAGTDQAAPALSDPVSLLVYLSDAGPDGTFFSDIGWAVDRQVFGGYTDGTFAPTSPVTRQVMAVALYRSTHFGDPDPSCTGSDRTFTDVPADNIFCGAVEWLAANGLTHGVDGESFAPTKPVTRQTAAAFLYRLGDSAGTDPTCEGSERTFDDVDADNPFCGVVEALAGEDIIQGTGDGSFAPRTVVTRQTAAALLHRTAQAAEATACLAPGGDGGVVVGSDEPGDPSLPEPTSGYRLGLTTVYAPSYLVTTSNAFATAAGCEVLKNGGTAADATVAVQAVLGLTVPEATGLGSGGFLMYYDAATGEVQAYDGRETAPMAATENYLRYVDDETDQTAPKPSARASGRSIGTPGIPRLIEKVQQDHGALPWRSLFDDAITLSTDGFKIGGRLANAIRSSANNFKRDPDAAAYFLNPDGTPKELGTLLKNPQYAAALQLLAENGADAFYTGTLAEDIVAKIGMSEGADGSVITPGKTTLDDLAGYQVKVREPVCTSYRDSYQICGMPPPTSGGITVASAMGILENFDLPAMAPTNVDGEGGEPQVQAVHLISEAERLAYADRDKYVADTDFVPLPGGTWDTLLNKEYLASRAALIDPDHSMGTALPGEFGEEPQGTDTTEEHGTNHFTIVDAQGNVVSATTTVEGSMGSYHMTHGFLLNNQLTDFSSSPVDSEGNPIANRVEPGKRPRSSMAPTVVFGLTDAGERGQFVMATGSPGGGTIPQYVVKALVGALDWGLNAQQASNLIDFGASNSPRTTVGGEHPNVDTSDGGINDPLIAGLQALGHQVSTGGQSSGVNSIMRVELDGRIVLAGGTDPRREGLVLGDTALG